MYSTKIFVIHRYIFVLDLTVLCNSSVSIKIDEIQSKSWDDVELLLGCN